jgi:hypothetical protein
MAPHVFGSEGRKNATGSVFFPSPLGVLCNRSGDILISAKDCVGVPFAYHTDCLHEEKVFEYRNASRSAAAAGGKKGLAKIIWNRFSRQRKLHRQSHHHVV